MLSLMRRSISARIPSTDATFVYRTASQKTASAGYTAFGQFHQRAVRHSTPYRQSLPSGSSLKKVGMMRRGETTSEDDGGRRVTGSGLFVLRTPLGNWRGLPLVSNVGTFTVGA